MRWCMRSYKNSGRLGYPFALSWPGGFCSIQDMTQGFGFLRLLGGRWGEGAGFRAPAAPGFRCHLFCLQIIMKNKIFNSIKITGP